MTSIQTTLLTAEERTQLPSFLEQSRRGKRVEEYPTERSSNTRRPCYKV
jgi:hypothetical protein